MLMELIATLVAGVAGAGLVLAANRILGGRLPRWMTPVAAGVAMLAVTISSEYNWYGRTRAALPAGLEVVQEVESRAFYRPWTYLYPFVGRFAAADLASRRQNAALPGQHMVDLYFFARWSPVSKLPVLVDCTGRRRAALADGAEFGADGAVTGADWVAAGADDPVLGAVCGAT